jgi:hypothetical protein
VRRFIGVLKANQETRQQVDNDLKQKRFTAENEAKQYWASVTNTVKTVN